MPIYEYRCESCGAQFEELCLSAKDGEAVTCRACSSRRVSKLLSAFAVHGGAAAAPTPEAGPCGGCGAAQRGMCGMEE